MSYTPCEHDPEGCPDCELLREGYSREEIEKAKALIIESAENFTVGTTALGPKEILVSNPDNVPTPQERMYREAHERGILRMSDREKRELTGENKEFFSRFFLFNHCQFVVSKWFRTAKSGFQGSMTHQFDEPNWTKCEKIAAKLLPEKEAEIKHPLRPFAQQALMEIQLEKAGANNE